MSEERKMKILVPTLIGTAFLNMVIFIVYIIQKHSTEVISFFIDVFSLLFFCNIIYCRSCYIKNFQEMEGKAVIYFFKIMLVSLVSKNFIWNINK